MKYTPPDVVPHLPMPRRQAIPWRGVFSCTRYKNLCNIFVLLINLAPTSHRLYRLVVNS